MLEDSFWIEQLSNSGVSSVTLVAILVTLSTLAVRVIRGQKEILSDYRRAWLARIRNATFITLLCLALIWLNSLRAFALSITAVALVIATKELILCLSGTVLRIVNQSFEIGDWVKIKTCAVRWSMKRCWQRPPGNRRGGGTP
ncbi:MAG: Mechanosensitive ion channel [Halomonas sp. HL-48]|nr:mechanosensitive ion channel [Halomonas sp. HL-48]KPQ25482.1 MAG: Mechanosensitive ion channel [Halomonas sp. HL-48]